MPIDRKRMYKFPWSKADNPGAWVEVTDECDLTCPGCYRHRLEGHRSLAEIEADVLLCQRLTNCGRMSIAGGEPLIYPRIVEVVDFIRRNGMQPVIFSNGQNLTRELALELKRAGLFQIYFHVDSGQARPGWQGRSESVLNELRQAYADMIADLGGVQCGINVTLTRKTLPEVPGILEWVRTNIAKVQNVSLIALRGLDLSAGKRYVVDGKTIDTSLWQSASPVSREISMTSEEIYEVVEKAFPETRPAAYLSGTARPETHKFLVVLYLGSPRRIYGTVGAKTVELDGVWTHFRKGRYMAGISKPKIGKGIFFLAGLDREVGKAFGRYLRTGLGNPVRLFDPVYIQCINIQQPNEILDGEVNLCDGCLNQMAYKGSLIPSCQLDEYRLYGGPFMEAAADAANAHADTG
jgi:pyruvate-formate lyase-activating enzyme